jgi:3-methylcrotonyl-CoA carboxylase alpha subunit
VKNAVGPGEAARRLGVSTRTVQRWLREGRLPAVNVGAHVKVDASALPRADVASEPPGTAPRIERLLVANRGELVVRIARTCRQLGIRCLALVPEDQARAWWTGAADEVVPLLGSYLDHEAVLSAARAARADALHPGYGFLAENANFAEAVERAGIRWVGPPPDAMRALGDKAAARRLADKIGVPILPGYDGEDQSDRRLGREARRIGLPLLVKPSAGGGGKGMHVVDDVARLSDTLARARREAAAAFGDERQILERYLPRPRHVEVQFLADVFGTAVHLGERECSLQRRHQKVIEEAPSVAVTPKHRKRLGDAAVALARSAGYVGAGTAEFLLADDGSFFFLEVNARLQVEHPVTELVTGRDLVADQLRIAGGQPLGFDQSSIAMNGHAVEARLYAEDPSSGFLPAIGEVVEVHWPRVEGVRVDAGVGATDVVGTRYDPLLAKLIAHGRDRAEALDRLASALEETSVLGVTTNRGFLQWLLANADVRSGKTYTTLINETWRPDPQLPAQAWQAAAAALSSAALAMASSGAVAARPGFRLNAAPRMRVTIETGERSTEIGPLPAGARWVARDDGSVVIDLGGRSVSARLAAAPTVESAVKTAGHQGAANESVTAPMPGTVISIRVGEGEQVEAGQVLVVLEAMKMENNVSAPRPSRVARVLVTAGQQVQRGETLVELT